MDHRARRQVESPIFAALRRFRRRKGGCINMTVVKVRSLILCSERGPASTPGVEHCCWYVTRWNISNRSTIKVINAGREYLLGRFGLGSFGPLSRAPSDAPSNNPPPSSPRPVNRPSAPGNHLVKQLRRKQMAPDKSKIRNDDSRGLSKMVVSTCAKPEVRRLRHTGQRMSL